MDDPTLNLYNIQSISKCQLYLQNIYMVMTCYGCLAEPSAFILKPQKLVLHRQPDEAYKTKTEKVLCFKFSSVLSLYTKLLPSCLYSPAYSLSLFSTFQPFMPSYQNQAYSSVIPSVWNDLSQMFGPVVIQVSAETSLPPERFLSEHTI